MSTIVDSTLSISARSISCQLSSNQLSLSMLNDMDCCTATAFVGESILLWSSTKCSKNCFCSSFRIRNELNSCTRKVVRLYSAMSFAILTDFLIFSILIVMFTLCMSSYRKLLDRPRILKNYVVNVVTKS